MIVTYLPSNYQNERKHQFDTYTEKKSKSIEKLRRNFIEKKYISASNKNYYMIVEEDEMAKWLKIGRNKVG